jgi:hypothetical protein
MSTLDDPALLYLNPSSAAWLQAAFLCNKANMIQVG